MLQTLTFGSCFTHQGDGEDEEGVYICRDCGKMFQSSRLLHEHELRVHSNEKRTTTHARREQEAEMEPETSDDNDAEVSDLMTSSKARDVSGDQSGGLFDESRDSEDNAHEQDIDEDSNLSSSIAGGNVSPAAFFLGRNGISRPLIHKMQTVCFVFVLSHCDDK